MKRIVIISIVVAALAGVAFYAGLFSGGAAAPGAGGAGQGEAAGAPGGRQGGGAGGRGGGRGQLTVELASATRASVNQELAVVGNLVGDQTVSVVPRAAGRLESITVKLGDRVTRGQRIAKIEDQELLEQVKQAEAAFQVASATIRQREADLELAKTNAERSRNLFQRQLLPQQTLDDSEAKYQSGQAALDLARAQNTQSQARLDELRATLQNTIITSPVNGFVARRGADPGAYVSANAPIVDLVDITNVRLVVNVIEKDLKQLAPGNSARVEVDAFPGESFEGRIARIAPVLDPATRTASIEIEIPNGQFRLKPGMYARVGIVTGSRPNALVVPTNSVVDVNGTRGVYLAVNNVAQFRPVTTGIESNTRTEILDGVSDGDRVVTTGAPALRNGDPIVLAGRGGAGGRQTQGGRTGGQPPDQSQATQGRQGGNVGEGGTVGEGGFGARRGAGASQGTGGSTAAPGGAASGDGNGAGRRSGSSGIGGRRGQGAAGVPQVTPETR